MAAKTTMLAKSGDPQGAFVFIVVFVSIAFDS
jgi:hypothetical protein